MVVGQTTSHGSIDRLAARLRALNGAGGAPGDMASLDSALEELRVTEEALVAARDEADRERERYYEMFEFAPDPYLVTTRSGSITEANRAATLFLGVGGNFVIGKPLSVYVHRDDRVLFAHLLTRMRQTLRGEWTLRIRPRSGDERVAHVTAGAVRKEDGELAAIRWMIRDVTDQHRAQRELLAGRKRIRDMASKLALVEEQERRQIANDIHDHISQSLAVVKLRLGLLSTTVPAEQRPSVDDLRGVLAHVIAQTRTLTFELSPTVLYELGLGPAIEWLLEQRSGCGIELKLHDQIDGTPLRREVSITLFRAIRELLANLIKHSGARVAHVDLDADQRSVRAEVRDDGAGFDVKQALSRKPQEQGLGLANIRERLEHLGGSMQIDSAPGQGTRIQLMIPTTRAKRRMKSGRPHADERNDC